MPESEQEFERLLAEAVADCVSWLDAADALEAARLRVNETSERRDNSYAALHRASAPGDGARVSRIYWEQVEAAREQETNDGE